MADSAIAVTAGAGTNVDTRTEGTNGNHRQVVVIGDPATNAGVAPVDATNGLAVQIIPALPAGTNAIGKLAANSGVDIGDVDVTSVPADPFGANADAASATGSISAKLRFIASTGIPITGTVTVTNAGTFAVQAAGDVTHDASDSGSPVKVGNKATTSLAGLTLVASGDRTDQLAGVDGVQIVRPHCNLEDIVTNVVTCTAGANTSAISAQGSGVKFYLTSCIVRNSGSSNGNLLLTDGSGGTTKADIPFPASTGAIFNPPVPIPFSANTAVYADPSGSDNVIVTLIGFKSKV